MATLDPVDYDLVHEVKTKKVKKGTQIDCWLKWKEDYPAGFKTSIGNSNSYVDLRKVHASRYEVDGQASGGDQTDVDHPMSWKGYINTNEIEIFAVIRAEYRFIDAGWQKKMSKKGAQGIDSLFFVQKGMSRYWAVVESKCTTNVKDYSKYVKGSSPLGRLGTANPKVKYQGKKEAIRESGVTQMTDPWIYHAFLQESSGKPVKEVMDNLKEFWADIGGGTVEPHKWLNVYGNDVFHIVPGVYESHATVSGKGSKQLEDIEVEWPDDYYRDYEFFALTTATDQDTTNEPLLTGKWHDLSAKFEQLCEDEMDDVDEDVYDQMMEDVEDKFG